MPRTDRIYNYPVAGAFENCKPSYFSCFTISDRIACLAIAIAGNCMLLCILKVVLI